MTLADLFIGISETSNQASERRHQELLAAISNFNEAEERRNDALVGALITVGRILEDIFCVP